MAHLRRLVRAGEVSADSADAAFSLAQQLAAAYPDDAAVRALGLEAQARYERYHGPVASGPLSPAEFAALRGDMLGALGAKGMLPAIPAVAPVEAAVPVAAARTAVAAYLHYPPEMAMLVAQQTALVRRAFRGVRGRQYYPMIERVFARHRLPAELKYVALIESGLNPHAVSSAGAGGLWQLMPDTGRDFGLDSLGIRDPARATEAAARFLGRLHRQFRGDWQLALAAYNAGPGRVQQIVAAHERRLGRYPTYWDIHAALPRETQLYVPRFIGAVTVFEGGRTS
ncbi:MAG: lytic transglycosylase domain-containing protein [Rubricoccaceae bacterium]